MADSAMGEQRVVKFPAIGPDDSFVKVVKALSTYESFFSSSSVTSNH